MLKHAKLLIALILFLNISLAQDNNMKYNILTPEEENVMLHKGTETPFTGKYYKFDKQGIYLCKRCNAPLFDSEYKFNSHCGWPSFDDELAGSVKKVVDADGMRTEILCANCGAHLGHIFYGEGYTDKNVRYCVNSLSMDFDPAESNVKTGRAIFASGCFWGTEYFFKKAKGVLYTTVGYTGGHTENPYYGDVCKGNTGHAEAVEVIFDPDQTSYEDLVKLFFETHDFTQLNRQGPDIGDQYRSEIFYIDEGQKNIALEYIRELKGKGYNVATDLNKAGKFWKAENYHQDYYEKTGGKPYCHSHKNIF